MSTYTDIVDILDTNELFEVVQKVDISDDGYSEDIGRAISGDGFCIVVGSQAVESIGSASCGSRSLVKKVINIFFFINPSKSEVSFDDIYVAVVDTIGRHKILDIYGYNLDIPLEAMVDNTSNKIVYRSQLSRVDVI